MAVNEIFPQDLLQAVRVVVLEYSHGGSGQAKAKNGTGVVLKGQRQVKVNKGNNVI